MPSRTESPAMALAKKIVARLQKENLLDLTRVDKFVDSLAAGKLREGDWKLAVEEVPKSSKKSSKKR